MEQNTRNKKKKGGVVTIIYENQGKHNSMIIQHLWHGSFEPIQRFHQLTDKIEALCGLPHHEELPQILRVSTMNDLPAIWRRVSLSPLEEKAIAIFSALAFSSGKNQLRLLREFFKREGWRIDLRGRPPLDPRDTDLLPLKRGFEIEKISAKLKAGFLFKKEAKKKGGFDGGEHRIAEQLKCRGYNDLEANAIVGARSAQDAACRYFQVTHDDVRFPRTSNKSIRNDYARFKSLRKKFPAYFGGVRPAPE